MVPQPNPEPYTKVVNDTGLDEEIAPAIISQAASKEDGYNKDLAGVALYAALLGAAGIGSPPSLSSTGWAVGIIGLLLASQSKHDIFETEDGKSRSRVLYLGDAVSRNVDEGGANEIAMYRAHMDGNVLWITEYFVPSAGAFLYSASDIIKEHTHGGISSREVRDLFSFAFPEPQVINPYRFISIRGMNPTPSSGTYGSGLPSYGLPKQGALIWYDADGKFMMQWESHRPQGGRQEDVVDRFGAGQDEASAEAILHLSDRYNTSVLVLNNWKVSDCDWAARVATQEEDSKGDIYRCALPFHYRSDFMTRSEGSHLFFPVIDEDWTYTTMIVKKD
ncbi:hypothetical protein CFAM422_006719 [Trichoderma lentiforme]|uniref:Uncharacterized protein n=1 Tax=Trichoderma lentiforme TaxID=1567552 RepID=A0A9P4XE27_9HYPO|nr:hypothetical protein CFAM422_006719 [Trichoderma lentiforme]